MAGGIAAMCTADSTRMNRIIRKDSLFNCSLRFPAPRGISPVSNRNGESLIPLTRITAMSCVDRPPRPLVRTVAGRLLI